jgi:hypothetical protein
VAAVALAACTSSEPASHQAAPGGDAGRLAASAPDLIVGGTGAGVLALQSDTGSVLFHGPAVPALGDWSELYTADRDGPATELRLTHLGSKSGGATGRVRGDLAIGAVSFDGTRVALTAPSPHGADPWIPRPRTTTDIVVANPTGIEGTERFHLQGNFVPEAFSSDDEYLFMIKYLPAADPVAYRVVSLELGEGDVYPVVGRNKTWSPKMAGSRLQQVPSPRGDMLYTLYSSQPARYARGHDPSQANAGGPVAFVHTLNLADHWAICVGLPRALWGGRSVDEAMALTPDGLDLYVVDAARGFIADMDTGKPKVVRSSRLTLGLPGEGQVHAAMGPDGHTVMVARGGRMVAVDTRSFEVTQRFSVAGPVSGIGWSDDGLRLYVAERGSIDVLDPETGKRVGRMGAPGLQSIDYVGTLGE